MQNMPFSLCFLHYIVTCRNNSKCWHICFHFAAATRRRPVSSTLRFLKVAVLLLLNSSDILPILSSPSNEILEKAEVFFGCMEQSNSGMPLSHFLLHTAGQLAKKEANNTHRLIC